MGLQFDEKFFKFELIEEMLEAIGHAA